MMIPSLPCKLFSNNCEKQLSLYTWRNKCPYLNTNGNKIYAGNLMHDEGRCKAQVKEQISKFGRSKHFWLYFLSRNTGQILRQLNESGGEVVRTHKYSCHW
jgi:uncharacterized protein YegJ (DUF2314 family)